jgi:hypothetical protein
MEQDEIYLIDLWRILVREWRWFVAVLAIGLVATFGWLHVARSQWEALAWIQIGQVGFAPTGVDPKVEPLLRVIERMDTVTFQDQVTTSLGLAHGSAEARLYRKTFKADPQPYANLFRLHIRAYSPRQAVELATATLATLQAIHHQIGEQPMKLARLRMAEIETDLRTALADRDRLVGAPSPGGRGDATPAIAGVMLAGKNEDIRALQQERSELRARMAANYTYETSTPWPVRVSDYPVFPNVVLTVGMGGVVSLFLAGVVAIWRNAIRRRSTKRSGQGTH